MDYLTRYILETIKSTKEGHKWFFDLYGKEFDIIIRSLNTNDKIYINNLKTEIANVIDDDVDIYWSDSFERMGKRLMIVRLNKLIK